MNYLILLILMLPIPLEVWYDTYCWRTGRDDKPSSTFFRVMAFILLSFVATIMLQGFRFDSITLGYLITGGLAGFGLHFLFFNYALNLSRKGVKIGYRKEGELLTPLFWVWELLLRLWVAWVTVLAFFHLDWIIDGVPQGTKLYEYFIYEKTKD